MGALKVASTDALGAVVVMRRGDGLAVNLDDEEELRLRRTVGRAARELRPTLREAMMTDLMMR